MSIPQGSPKAEAQAVSEASLEKTVSHYKPCDPDEIAKSLSETYKHLPKEVYFKPTSSDTRSSKIAMSLDALDVQRIAVHEKWGAEPYEHSGYMPEDLVMVTSRGERMRSKAEVLIAEKLYEYGIPFRYEQPLHLGPRTFCPDFTFEGAGGDLFFLEYCGKMDDPEYAASYLKKRSAYEAEGVVEWKNIIYLYSIGNDMNMMHIDSVIRTKVIPWL